MTTDVSFLLVHGSWHGSWCWEPLVGELERDGHRAATVDLPSVGDDVAHLGGLTDDAAAVAEAARRIDGPVVVVGHSYGGAVITEAVYDADVVRLVYLGAFMPDSGRPFASYLPPGPLPPYVGLRDDGSMAVPSGEARGAFYADCADDVAEWATSRLRPQSQAVLGPPITHASWRTIPSTYVVLTRDAAIPPALQRQFADQATGSVDLDSDHSPMLSHPAELAAILARIAVGATAPT